MQILLWNCNTKAYIFQGMYLKKNPLEADVVYTYFSLVVIHMSEES